MEFAHTWFAMANYPRYAIIRDDATFHVTWQCHNKHWLLASHEAKRLYHQLLKKYKDRYKIKIYSYCFMSSHPHLTGHCEDKKLFSDFFRVVNACFARTYNKWHGRRGQVVMDRFKSPCVDTHADHLRVMFYNDLNPNRAHMVKDPAEFQWSSYHHYADGKEDELITDAPCYIALGATAKERQLVYRARIKEILQNDWKEKQPYSSVPFIGDPMWVERKLEELKKLVRGRREKWQKNYRLKFGNNNSP